MPIQTGGVQYYNQKFIDTAEHYDEFIMERSLANPNVYRDRVPRGAFGLFEGMSKTSNIWRGGLGEQAGLTNWSPIQPSRKPATGDAGFDACNYNPQTFNYAWESIKYSGYKSSWQSMPICINDIKYVAEGKEQCRLQAAQCSYVTLTVWENISREFYIKQAVDAGHAVVLAEGGMNYLDDATVRFSYDPFTADTDGDTTITIPLALQLSTLNWSFLDYIHDYLADQCSEAALAMDGGMPVFGLIADVRDIEKSVKADADLREDFRFAKPEQLITDFRVGFKKFRGWAIAHDPRQPRFRFDHVSGTNAVCKRVKPLREGRAVTIGNVPEANPDYQKAEIGMAVVFMSDVYVNQVPPTVADMGSGMVFGSQPGYNGQFAWINEYDRQLNPMRDVGYFFARYEVFPKPLMYATEAVVMLYRRCPQAWRTVCEIQDTDDVGSGAIAVAAAAASADVDSTLYRLTLTLSKKLDAGIGDTVTIARSTTSSDTAYIVEDADAPEYVFGKATAFGAYTDYAVGATVTVA